MLSVYVHCNISNVAKNVIKLLHYCYINVGVFPQINIRLRRKKVRVRFLRVYDLSKKPKRLNGVLKKKTLV